MHHSAASAHPNILDNATREEKMTMVEIIVDAEARAREKIEQAEKGTDSFLLLCVEAKELVDRAEVDAEEELKEYREKRDAEIKDMQERVRFWMPIL